MPKRKGARDRARHVDSLNKKRARRENKKLMRDCEPTWQDKLLMWSKKELPGSCQCVLRRLMQRGRCALPCKSVPHDVLACLARHCVIVQSEGFFMISKPSRLSENGLI